MNYLQLAPGERELYSCRTHWKNYVPPFIAAGVCLLFLVIRIYFYGYPLILDLAKYFEGISYRKVSLLETGLGIVLMFWCLSAGLRQVFVKYIITTDRLIHHRGFLNTRTTELKLCYCSNLILIQNLGGKIFQYGDFKLRAGGVDMFFNDVPSPLRFKRTLTDAINDSVYGGYQKSTSALDFLEEELGLKP